MATLEEMKARLWYADLRLWIWRWQTLSPEDRAIFYKQPERKKIVHIKRDRTYGLTKYQADVIVDAGPEVCEYFEEFVEIAKYLSEQIEEGVEYEFGSGQAVAKFIINDLFAVVKRNGVSLEDIPIPFAACMLIDRRRLLITNKQIKEKFDQMFVRN